MNKIVIWSAGVIVGLGAVAATNMLVRQRRVKRFQNDLSAYVGDYIREQFTDEYIFGKDDSQILEITIPLFMENTEEGCITTVETPIEISVGMMKRILNNEYVEINIGSR